ncbi:hypothetical protein A3193_03310 [Candidatus Thiodiazotropha endoloripes]|uniref:hypothetical protein n=1 Tax=Candidatus Thiodiazotropha endoloripes TaxID=1818881 RepID=UPI00083CD5A2|nr:hypothetical protein [Candidatus Thiodiazotropha endoloripes]ODB87939.1 hypothetical protein A3193_03310 [Candidatus Thiodiazotropha endoloripes]
MKRNITIPEKGEAGEDELILARSVLLANMFSGKVPPQDILRCVRRYSEVTHWEEVLCAAIYPKAGKLIAIVSRRQPEGYSGILRRHGSVQYVRFFIDWGDQAGFQALGLSHFKVSDAAADESETRFPVCHLVSLGFNADRYWESLMQGYRPIVRAVLSWNLVPELDPEFVPIFGNRIDSQIQVESEKELLFHFKMPISGHQQGDHRSPCLMA